MAKKSPEIDRVQREKWAAELANAIGVRDALIDAERQRRAEAKAEIDQEDAWIVELARCIRGDGAAQVTLDAFRDADDGGGT